MPDWQEEICRRLRSLRLAPAREAEIVEELTQHLEDRFQELVVGGSTEDEARRMALEELRDEDLLPRGLRRAEQEVPPEPVAQGGGGRGNLLASIWQDIHYDMRTLAKNPGLATTAVITLALGIGLNTAVFSIVNALLFRPLPVSHPEQIYTLSAERKRHSSGNMFSYQDLEEIRTQTSAVFSDVAGVAGLGSSAGLSVSGTSGRMWTHFVTGNFFSLLGIRPALGRLILPGEGSVAGADPVLVLGYSFWRVHFGGDASIIGKKALVNGRPVTIVGVAPEGFRSVTPFFDMQGYMPLGMAVIDSQSAPDFLSDRRAKSLILIARVRRGASQKVIRTTADVAAKRLAAQFPKADDWTSLNAFPLPRTGPTSHPQHPLAVVSALFLALAVVVLIVACLNIANLLLARMNARRGEIAIRAALGATRSRLICHLLSESLLLALFGCLVGIVVVFAGNRALSSLPLQTGFGFSLILDFHFDWRVFTYAFAAAFLAGAIAGIAPALQTTACNLNEVLHGSQRTVAAGGHRLRSSLVVSQVGGSLMLLIVAGLFVRSLLSVQRSDLGFDPHHVLNITIDPHLAGYSQTQASEFVEGLVERARTLPGVLSASLAAIVPMSGYDMGDYLEVEGFRLPPGEQAALVGFNVVSPGYFETMRIPLLRGRDIRETDNQNSMHVAVINQAMAERFWQGQDPIGKEFRLKGDLRHPLEVAGVARNSRTADLYSPVVPFFYLALAQNEMLPLTLQARTAGDPEPVAQEILRLTKSLEPALPLAEVQTMTKALDTPNGLLLFRLGAGLAAAMAVLGLILAIIGVYGVVSYMTTQRTHEIGVRLALGALPPQILRAVLRQGMLIVALGSAAGILVAFGLARLAGSLLIGVTATDPLTFASAALVLALVALVACYIPARRATKVDPMVALRYE
jgi:putative ABC transport system permease protein